MTPRPIGLRRITPEEAQQIRESWAWRALAEARKAYESSGGDNPMFLILQAAMKLTPTAYPYFEPFGIIDERGFVRTNRYTSETSRDTAYRVCSVRDLAFNLGRLSEALRLRDSDHNALLAKVKTWITADDREGQANTARERLPGVKAVDRRHDVD